MDNQTIRQEDFCCQDFFVFTYFFRNDNDVWGYSSVVERMLCMYDVLGSIPSISSLNYLFPSVTFLYFRKTSIGLERFFPKWTIRQEQFWCQDFFGFALTRILGDIAQWQSACFACMMSWVQSPVSPVVHFFAQGLRFFSEMDNQVGAFVESRFFLVSHENALWGYSSVVECMLRMYEVLGSIPSLNYLFPSFFTSILERFFPKWTIRQEQFWCQDFFGFALTFPWGKTSIGLERFFPKWTIRQEHLWSQDFFWFPMKMLCGDIAQWQSACFACMKSWVQSPVSPVVSFFAQV